jgi:hypothetical protein
MPRIGSQAELQAEEKHEQQRQPERRHRLAE